MSATEVVYWLLAALSLLGAAGVVFLRDVTRMALALGVFLLSVAGWFLYFNQAFLAVAQVFVYVGGVLVLVLFAIMLLHRGEKDAPGLESRHSVDSALVAGGLFVIIVAVFAQSTAGLLGGEPATAIPVEVSTTLLGTMLPQFEALGVLLLAALAAVIAIVGGGER